MKLSKSLIFISQILLLISCNVPLKEDFYGEWFAANEFYLRIYERKTYSRCQILSLDLPVVYQKDDVFYVGDGENLTLKNKILQLNQDSLMLIAADLETMEYYSILGNSNGTNVDFSDTIKLYNKNFLKRSKMRFDSLVYMDFFENEIEHHMFINSNGELLLKGYMYRINNRDSFDQNQYYSSKLTYTEIEHLNETLIGNGANIMSTNSVDPSAKLKIYWSNGTITHLRVSNSLPNYYIEISALLFQKIILPTLQKNSVVRSTKNIEKI